MKNVCSSKDTMKEMRSQTQENYWQTYTSRQGLVTRLYKEFLQISKRMTADVKTRDVRMASSERTEGRPASPGDTPRSSLRGLHLQPHSTARALDRPRQVSHACEPLSAPTTGVDRTRRVPLAVPHRPARALTACGQALPSQTFPQRNHTDVYTAPSSATLPVTTTYWRQPKSARGERMETLCYLRTTKHASAAFL